MKRYKSVICTNQNTFVNSFKKYLDNIHSISDQDFKEGFKLFQEVQVQKGEYFIKQGEICDRIGFVVRGTLRIFSIDQAGDEVTTCFCTADKMTTSYKSFIRQEASNFAIQAIENTQLFTITSQNLEKLYHQNIAWSKIGRKLTEMEYVVMEDYAVMLNRESAKEKYKKLILEIPGIVQVAKIQYLASYLGVTRRTLTRIREEILHEK